MCMNKNSNKACCCLFSILTAVISAVGIAAIFFSGLITSANGLIYATLILGILALLYILFTVFCGHKHNCNKISDCLVASVVGSLVTSIVALTVTELVAASVTVAILIGVIAFFLVSTLINVVSLIINKLCNGCCDN